MASFCGLCDEFGLEVVKSVVLGSVVNFALCCRLVHDLAGKTLTLGSTRHTERCTPTYIPLWC